VERKIKVNYQGKMVDGNEIEFKSTKEEFNVYEISDGTILRMKSVVMSIVKLLDEYDPAGNPVYVVQASNVMSVSAPEELKQGAGHPKGH
jgi:hypothetical protein